MTTAAGRRVRVILLAVLMLTAFAVGSVPAQDVSGRSEPPATQVQSPGGDLLGRSTPRGMVDGLLLAMAADDPSALLDFLDLSGLPEGQRSWRARRIATALEAVLDRRGGLLPSYRISMSEAGALQDGLPPDQDVFAQMRTSEGPVDLIAHQTRTPDGVVVWLVSPETLAKVEAQAPFAPVALVEEIMPRAWSDARAAGAPVSHWIALVIAATIALAAGWSAAGIFTIILQRIIGKHIVASSRTSTVALGAVIGCMLFGWLPGVLGVSIVARASVAPAVEIIAWMALATLAWATVDQFARAWLSALTRRGVVAAISLVTLARRGSKILITIAAILATFSSLGVDLTAWLAAFGIGGLVIALGAQKTVEHLVGTLSIVADKPIRVGDVCQVDGLLGTVEDIGIRSTRIRTFERTVVTVPNGIMSSARIETYALRDRFLFRHVLRLQLDTPPEQIRLVLDGLNQALVETEAVAPDPRRARLVSLAPESLEIEVFAYITAPDFDAFLAQGEALLLRLLDVVEACGAHLAIPARRVNIIGEDCGSSARASGKGG